MTHKKKPNIKACLVQKKEAKRNKGRKNNTTKCKSVTPNQKQTQVSIVVQWRGWLDRPTNLILLPLSITSNFIRYFSFEIVKTKSCIYEI